MRYFVILFALVASTPLFSGGQSPANAARDSDMVRVLQTNRYNLERGGIDFLAAQGRRSQFFFLGETHLSREMPALIRELWPLLHTAGYSHIAIELGPWMSSLLDAGKLDAFRRLKPGLFQPWAEEEISLTRMYTASRVDHTAAIWGIDQELEPGDLVDNLLRLKPGNKILQQLKSELAGGFKRQDAARLMQQAQGLPAGAGEWQEQLGLLKETLAVWVAKANPDSKLQGQALRENLMKRNFVRDYGAAQRAETAPRVLLRLGRNHGHRGYDRRGVSTLGNFVAEFAIAQGGTMFNVGVFSGGGKVMDEGLEYSMDERGDDPAFRLLADIAGNQPTVFDLRPLRQILHQKSDSPPTALQGSLEYWADSYDSLIYYPKITQLEF